MNFLLNMHIIVNLKLALWIWIILCFSKVCVRNVRNCVNGFACVKWIMLKFSVKLLSLLLRLMLGSKEGCVNKGFVWFCGWWQAVKARSPAGSELSLATPPSSQTPPPAWCPGALPLAGNQCKWSKTSKWDRLKYLYEGFKIEINMPSPW